MARSSRTITQGGLPRSAEVPENRRFYEVSVRDRFPFRHGISPAVVGKICWRRKDRGGNSGET